MFHSASCAIEVPTVLASVVRAQRLSSLQRTQLFWCLHRRDWRHIPRPYSNHASICTLNDHHTSQIWHIYMYYFIFNNIICIVPSASVDAWHLFSAKSTTQDALCNNFELSLQLTRSQARFWCRCIGTWKEATLSLVQRMTRQPL